MLMSSRIGVIFVISVATGEILDYCVKSLLCHACKAHCKDDRNSDEHKKWKEEHQPKYVKSIIMDRQKIWKQQLQLKSSPQAFHQES